MIKGYWIERERRGHKIINYCVTDGLWHSRDYATLKEARNCLNKALWGHTDQL
jgi:hypothetical protein